MLNKIKDGLRRFFCGRYGSDQLCRALLILSLVLLVIGFVGTKLGLSWFAVVTLLAYVPLGWCAGRMFSRNFEARRRENSAFMRVWGRLTDKSHRYFRCPSCKQIVRVPRGKGKISIRCPKCSTRFIKKT